jgi:NAD(P)-dependent dehydrogenase (short-subunit alcohol dehydrogenase family)
MSKVWLITGASRGLGRAFTEAALEAGDRVVATARNPEQLVELQGRYSGRIRTVALDVTNEAQAKAAFEVAIASFGVLDVLVNNAGYGYVCPVKAAAQNAQSAANQGISKASEAESSATMAQDSANQASRDAQAAGALGSADAAALSDSGSWALPRQTASESKNFPVSIKIGNEKS